MNKKLISILLVVFFCVMVFAGCQSSPPAETASAAASAQETKEAAPAPAGEEQTNAPAASSSSDTLVYALSNDVDDFDPFTNQTLTFIKTIGYNCYESLLHIGEDMSYVPDLAVSWENPDEKTYIFKLREGVKFHNGNPMTAEDVRFSFEYAMDEANASWLGAFFKVVEKVEAVDETTVKFTLNSVSNTFLDDVAMVKIINKGTEGALKQTPIGTGAFKFVKWEPNSNITFEKFADYWDADVVKLNTLILKPIPDKKIQLTNLASGDVNLVEDLPMSEIESIEGNDALNVIQSKSSNSTVLFEIGRHNKKEFSNPKVMEALFHAFNKDVINTSVYKGLGKVIWSPYPSGAKYYKDIAGNAYDLELAKSMLDEAGVSNLEFDLYIATGFIEWEKLAVLYQADLQKIGVKMNIKKVEFSEWLDAYLGRTYDMIINQYPMAGTDPAVYNSIILTQLADYQLKDQPEILALIDEGAKESDDAKRKEIYEKIQDLVFEIKPVASIVEAPILYGATSGLEGIVINPVGHTFLKEASFK